MNDFDYRPQLASDPDRRETVSRMLTREGYEFSESASVGEYRIDFVAWKPEPPDYVIMTLAASAADVAMVGRILAFSVDIVTSKVGTLAPRAVPTQIYGFHLCFP